MIVRAATSFRYLLQLAVPSRVAIVLLPVQLGDSRHDVIGTHGFFFVGESTQERCIAERVDKTRHATGISIDDLERRVIKQIIGFPTRDAKAVVDILVHFTGIQRADMKAQANALHKLLELACFQRVLEFRLSGQNDPKNLFLVGFDTRQQAYFLEDLLRQVLCLVHNEHDLLAVRILLDKEHVEHVQ